MSKRQHQELLNQSNIMNKCTKCGVELIPAGSLGAVQVCNSNGDVIGMRTNSVYVCNNKDCGHFNILKGDQEEFKLWQENQN